MNPELDKHVDLSVLNSKRVDPFLQSLGQTTLNKDYLPLSRNNSRSVRSGSTFKNVPPSYMPAYIRLYYAGSLANQIPILFPLEASESLGANFIIESPVGSTYPIIAFSNSQPTEISISFKALSDYLPTGYSSFKQYIEAIRSMVKPQYSGNYVKSPEVHVQLSSVDFYGVCKSVNISYTNLYGDKTFVVADISCSFTILHR